jgi:hypothetical protein
MNVPMCPNVPQRAPGTDEPNVPRAPYIGGGRQPVTHAFPAAPWGA